MVEGLVLTFLVKTDAIQIADFHGCLAIFLQMTNDDRKFVCDIKQSRWSSQMFALMNEWSSFHHPLYVFVISSSSNKEDL